MLNQDLLASQALFDLGQQQAAENLSQEDRGDDMGQLYQLQGTSEPFATHLWDFWISERGPGYQEGKVLKCVARVSKMPIDLAKLWREVNRRGGSELVTATKGWATVGRCFNPSPTCTSLSYNVRRVYQHALLSLEMLMRHKGVKVEGVELPESEADLMQFDKVSTSRQSNGGKDRQNRRRTLQAAPTLSLSLCQRAPQLHYRGIKTKEEKKERMMDIDEPDSPAPAQDDTARKVMYSELEEFYNSKKSAQGSQFFVNSAKAFGDVSHKVIGRYFSNYDLSQEGKVYEDYVEVDGLQIKQCSKSPVAAFMENQHVPKRRKKKE